MGKVHIYGLDDFFTALGEGPLLSSPITEVDATLVGDHPLTTVPTDRLMYVTKLLILLTNVSGGGAKPKVTLGYNSPDFDDIILPTTLISLDTVNDAFLIDIEGLIKAGVAADVLTARIDTASGFTDYDLSIGVFGVTTNA